LWETGDLNAARTSLMESLSLFTEALGQDPNNGDWIREQYLAEERMGLVSGHPDSFNLGDSRAAIIWLQKYLQGQEHLMAADPNDVRARSGASACLEELADVYYDLDTARSEKLYRRALALTASALESDPQDSWILYVDSSNRIGLAALLERLGKHGQAGDQWQHAISVLEDLQRRDSAEIQAPQLLGVALRRRALALLARRDFAGAEQDIARSERILGSLYGQNPNNLLILRDLADSYRAAGDLAAHRSRWADANREYQKSLDLWQKWLQIGKTSVFDQRQREVAASLVRKSLQHLRNSLSSAGSSQ
jgi:tetratricopeptide (TPR) repeat protein